MRAGEVRAAQVRDFEVRAGEVRGAEGLTAGQRTEVAAYEKLIAELRELNSEVLAAAAELSHGTIETVLAKSDLQLGAEVPLRRPRA